MSEATLFRDFRDNLAISNTEDISTKYRNITSRLNVDFWDIDSDTSHSLQIGSYGRRTAIDGVSDLDMVFELPPEKLAQYKKQEGNGPSAMLQDVRQSLLNRYPKTDVRADRQVVGVHFSGYRVEVLPAFLDENGDYIHGDTNDGGSWKLTKPRPEIKAVNDLNNVTNGNLKNICKMLRAWRNKVGIGIGGLLIDTLVYNFFDAHHEYNEATFERYPELFSTLFAYLAGLDEQEYYLAPGSRQRVKCKAKFQNKARRAVARCQEAIEEGDLEKKAEIWRKLFGNKFPKIESAKTASADPYDKEEFIEDKHPVDIRYSISLDCEIREGTLLREILRQLLKNKGRVPIGRSLRFFVTDCDVPGNYAIFWKVRNRGQVAIDSRRRRGEISFDVDNRKEKIETTDFPGNHYVEVYAVKDGVCVARERIPVPI